MRYFRLPEVVSELVEARRRLRERYSASGLQFTFDGNLVGDIGEAIAAECFGIELTAKCGKGIDGRRPDNGRTVQVKATGTLRGPAFRNVDTRADDLLFLALDFEKAVGEVVYNGPEHPVTACLPTIWTGQRAVSLARMRTCAAMVNDEERIPLLADAQADFVLNVPS